MTLLTTERLFWHCGDRVAKLWSGTRGCFHIAIFFFRYVPCTPFCPEFRKSTPIRRTLEWAPVLDVHVDRIAA